MAYLQARSTLRDAIVRYRSAFLTVALLSAVLNVLLLGGSIYMMLVYDSVLPSHSLPTLFSLFAMVVVVYVFQAMFETVRGRILADVGSGLDRELAPEVQRLISDAAQRGHRGVGDGLIPMRDLDHVRAFLSGGGPAALIDLPWMLFFLGVLFMLHYWLGIAALAGSAVLVALTLLTEWRTREPIGALSQIAAKRMGLAESNARHAELLTALGMRNRMRARWLDINDGYLAANERLSRTISTFGGMSKIFRLLLQSLILTVGALLVIDGRASGGVIFASSILSGRALAPVDAAIANWRGLAQARLGWRRLGDLLARFPDVATSGTVLPEPTQGLAVQGLVVAPPGTERITVQTADFTLKAGEGLAIIGPSASGKTSLARALIGVWPPLRGAVRLDGATLDQWSPEALGAFMGYLPQTVELLEGTVAENIARFESDPDSAAVIGAARAAGVHDMIVQLPGGYDAMVGADGSLLSAGQRQRIGLARALYRDPFVVLLDEPNSNLDASGEAALNASIGAVRARGGIAIVIAHRPSALAQVSHVCFMRNGRIEAFGPRDATLEKISAKPVPLRAARPPPARWPRSRKPDPMPANLIAKLSGEDLRRPAAQDAQRIMAARLRSSLIAIGVLVFGFGGAMVLVPIGGAVVGSGQVGVESRIKRVAHPTGGIISAIYVQNGDHVAKGAILMRLDDEVAGTQSELSSLSVDQLMAQRARLEAERLGAATLAFPPELAARGGAGARKAMEDEQKLFRIRQSEQGGMRAQLAARVSQYRKEIDGYRAQIRSYQTQTALIEPERASVKELWDRNLVTISRLNQIERTSADMQGSIASLQSHIAQTEARITEANEQLLQLGQARRGEAGTQLATVNGALNQERMRSVNASDQHDRSIIRAPYAGTVDKLAFATIGDVVKPAETIMEVVPDGDRLLVEATINPQDIDQVVKGQRARIRFSAFNSTATPDIAGQVSFVAPERTTDPNARQSFYAIRVEVDARDLARWPELKLRPGMPAEIFVQTGSRSMLSYITKPLRDQFARAFRDN